MRTKKCHGCGESFLRDQLIDYASPGAKTLYSYCQKCYKEKIAKDKFSEKVCLIFGLKNPGPRIWKDRKLIQEKYGYTDDTIVDCLDYIYNVKKLKKLSESLCLVTPTNIEQMMQYKRQQEYNNNKIISAMKTETCEHIVNIKENTSSNKTEWNPDDWIDYD